MNGETYAVLVGGLVMVILRLANILVVWVSKKLGVEEKPSLFNDPEVGNRGGPPLTG